MAQTAYNYGVSSIPDGTANTLDDEQNAQKQDQPNYAAPAPYSPPSTSSSAPKPTDVSTPTPTFAQLQANGEARPPAPDPGGTPQGAGTGSTLAQAAPAPMPPPEMPFDPNAVANSNAGGGWYDATGYHAGTPSGATVLQNAQPNADAAKNTLVNSSNFNVGTGQNFENMGGTLTDPGLIAALKAQGVNSAYGMVLDPTAYNVQQTGAAQGSYQDVLNSGGTNQGSGGNMAVNGVNQGIAGTTAGFQDWLKNGGYGQQYGVDPTTATLPGGGALVTSPIQFNGQSVAPGTSIPNASISGAPGSSSAPAPFTPNSPTPTPSGTGATLPGATGTAGTATGTNPASPPGFDILNTLVNGAQGNGAGSAVQNATQANTLALLQNPNAYGTKDVQDLYNTLGGQIDDSYALQQKQIAEDMARRGLSAGSTIGAGQLSDLNIGKRSAKTTLANDLAQNYAQTANSANLAAIGAGNTVGSTAQNNNLSWLQNLMGYGQQGFNNDLATNQQNQNASNSYQNFILGLLGYGQGAGA